MLSRDPEVLKRVLLGRGASQKRTPVSVDSEPAPDRQPPFRPRKSFPSPLWNQAPGEIDLARELQVGRNTIRAALEVLEKEELIRTVPGRRREILGIMVPQERPPREKVAVLLLPAPWQTLPPSTLIWMDGQHDPGEPSGC